MLVKSMSRITGKRVNPHLLRHVVVTHARKQELSERQLEGLARLMGHSLREQRRTYDKCTASDKIAPAVGVLSQWLEAARRTCS